MNRIALTMVFLFASIAPAWALVDFSRVRCDAPEIKKIILEDFPKMKFSDGALFAQHLDVSAIQKIETLKAEKNALVCRLTINVGYGADRRSVRGKFAFKQFSDGRISESWTPNY